jgi:hypothetical protein
MIAVDFFISACNRKSARLEPSHSPAPWTAKLQEVVHSKRSAIEADLPGDSFWPHLLRSLTFILAMFEGIWDFVPQHCTAKRSDSPEDRGFVLDL